MNTVTRTISNVLQGIFKAVKVYPASITYAALFAIVTMIRIHLDWPEQEAYNFLFNCLHWSFAFGAVFSLAISTAAHSRYNTSKALWITNAVGFAVVLFCFLMMYYFGGSEAGAVTSRFEVVSRLAGTRVSVGIFVSFLTFIMLAGSIGQGSDLSRSLFMTQKALFIALIYGFVITIGATGVAGAIENLLYNDMSEKVYMYITTISAFLSFTIFVGYFPDFRKGVVDERLEIVQKQAQFVEVLFSYIMVPIVLALTVVLLLWTGRTIITGSWPDFIELSSIATTYAIGGIWLHVMVSHHTSSLASFYKKVYPVTALVVLAFEAQALVIQLAEFGLKTIEYYFILTWIVGVVSAVLLLILKSKSHSMIVVMICIVSIISVLPLAGYHSVPVMAQIGRLEEMLVKEGILVNESLIPAKTEPELTIREGITDAVIFLAYAENAKLPDWFDKQLAENDVFKSKLGFEKTLTRYGAEDMDRSYMGLSLAIPSKAIDISGYDWMLTFTESYRLGGETVMVETDRGTYQFTWKPSSSRKVPSLKVLLNDSVVIDQDMNDYLDHLMELYPLGERRTSNAKVEDMIFIIEENDIEVLLVFNNIEINVDTRNDYIDYWLNLHGVYMREK